MKIISLVTRGVFAVILTALLASFAISLGTGIMVSVFGSPQASPSMAGYFEAIGFVAFLGMAVAVPAAAAVALIVEIPHAIIARRRQLQPPLHYAVSITGAIALWVVFVAITTDAGDIIGNDDLAFSLIAFVIGGTCSAFVWRALVIEARPRPNSL
ncbi:hypothetical protein [Qipengyuania flava]|uniref:hypothetical protein n=1 Tax=Qipengyuania flava TaxID=192812 RepID=UPI001C632474|nr:hypothetical protein [Qipengyuania flava]QYJ08040.1 hypothetical protein KUV82_04850 [Qipengyuania flava]